MISHDALRPPQLEFAFELRVNIGPTLELGPSAGGVRRTVPITGGVFHGPHISGRVLPGGADWQFVEADGLAFLDAHYVIETEDGHRIEVRNQGVRHGSPEVLTRRADGKSVAPEEYYFRTTPRFYPATGQCDWLKRSIFVGMGERQADLVVVRVWKLG
ncbi:MAG TPA: DUF3237 domain-containing protein [Acidobacteriaceae bacterium]|jgi:hypothetical protein|nr:DUF3237 domain-containing protein [Acidobacteriaceae bacterium]